MQVEVLQCFGEMKRFSTLSIVGDRQLPMGIESQESWKKHRSDV
jgi:hypothetical protein